MPKRVTQSDVARRAGVSRATVSYVLNARPQSRIPITAETRQRVLAAAEELGYHPDARARSLRSGQTHVIGLVISEAYNPHFWAFVQGIDAVARERGYSLVLSVCGQERERVRDCLSILPERRVDGLILQLGVDPTVVSAELDALRLQRAPVVGLGTHIPGADHVGQDYYLGAGRLMEHLIGLGHRRIAFIHGATHPQAGAERLRAYREALAAAGLSHDEELVTYCGPRLGDGLAAAEQLLAIVPRPTAIIGLNDLMAIGALQAAGRAGLCVPGDLSVAGFDDIEVAAYLVPPLTTVRVHTEEAGQRAAELLLRRIENPGAPPQRLMLPGELVVRGSTGPASVKRQVPCVIRDTRGEA